MVITLIYAIVFIGMLIVRPGSRYFYDTFFNTYQILPPLMAGIAGLIYYRFGQHTNSLRRYGWLLIALACLSFVVGQGTWTYFESICGIQVPFPSLADAGYIGNYIFMIPGVLLLFGSINVAGRFRLLLDGAITAGSVGILSYSFLVQQIWHQSDVTFVGKIISVAYPLGDIAALFGAVILISNVRDMRRPLYFLALGIIGFAFFDMSFTWMSLNNTYQTGSWSDWTISFGWILVGYSFLTQMWWIDKEKSTYKDPSSPQIQRMWQIILPYIAVMVSCSIVGIHDYIKFGEFNSSSVIVGMFLMGLVMIRQILALLENRSLTIELKAFNDNLEKLVAKRTQELENQNKTILTMVEERNRFYRHVSHEVRTPLTSVIGFSKIMMEEDDEPLTPRQKTQLQKVVDGAYKLLEMINVLLDISKIESQRMEVNYSGVSLNAMIRQIVNNLSPLAQEKALEIKEDVASDLPFIITDEQKMTQIIVNLLSNAIKYTHKGTICISAIMNCESVSIFIEDTGVGIPEEDMDNIFREFYQVQNSSMQQGSGLGLAIVKKLVELLNGQIAVQSELGVGSKFILTIPVIPNKYLS